MERGLPGATPAAGDRYAVIAGNGGFPFLVLEAARGQGIEPLDNGLNLLFEEGLQRPLQFLFGLFLEVQMHLAHRQHPGGVAIQLGLHFHRCRGRLDQCAE